LVTDPATQLPSHPGITLPWDAIFLPFPKRSPQMVSQGSDRFVLNVGKLLGKAT